MAIMGITLARFSNCVHVLCAILLFKKGGFVDATKEC